MMTYQIINLVATGDLKQQINLNDISTLKHTIYNQEIYGGRVAYLKTPEMNGKVTIFPSGKLISIGTKSPEQAQQDLQYTVDYLVKNKLITFTHIKSKIRNIVAMITIKMKLSLEEIADIHNVIYEPEQFSGAILKRTETNATYLIFQSGKIIIAGTRSIDELKKAVQFIIKSSADGLF